MAVGPDCLDVNLEEVIAAAPREAVLRSLRFRVCSVYLLGEIQSFVGFGVFFGFGFVLGPPERHFVGGFWLGFTF